MTAGQDRDIRERIEKLDADEAKAALMGLLANRLFVDIDNWGAWYDLFPHGEFAFKKEVMP